MTEQTIDLTALPKIELTLVGIDGNAFSVIGAVTKAARNQGWDKDARDALRDEMMSGDYNHLLATALKYTVPPEEEDIEEEDDNICIRCCATIDNWYDELCQWCEDKEEEEARL